MVDRREELAEKFGRAVAYYAISVSVATCPEDGDTPEDMTACTDRAESVGKSRIFGGMEDI